MVTETETPRLTLSVRVFIGHYDFLHPDVESYDFHFDIKGRMDGGSDGLSIGLPIGHSNSGPECLESDVHNGSELPLEVLRRTVELVGKLYLYNGDLKRGQDLLAFLDPHAAILELHYFEDEWERLQKRRIKLDEEMDTTQKAIAYARVEVEAEAENDDH